MAVDYLSAINKQGSGLNITQIVDSLVAAETAPIESRIQRNIDETNATISAYGVLANELGKLKDFAAASKGTTAFAVNSSSTAIGVTVTDPTKAKEFNDFDCIIPVPLHQKKLQKRGYNQLTRFGEKLAELLQIDYVENLLERVSFTNTQTKKKRLDRFQNTSSKFVLKDLKKLQNNHVLLIDDVVTTGATLEACCKELLKVDGIKISIVTMAITE